MKMMFKLFSHLYNILFIVIAYRLKSEFLLYFVVECGSGFVQTKLSNDVGN